MAVLVVAVIVIAVCLAAAGSVHGKIGWLAGGFVVGRWSKRR